MICARYFYNIFRRVHTMQFHLKTPYEWFNLHNFPSETPLNLGRGRSRECHVITPQPIQVSLIMQKHDFGLFNVVKRARHGGRSKHLGVPVIIEGPLRKKFFTSIRPRHLG